MAELPEVHTIVSDLNQHISGFFIKKVIVTKNYSVKPDNKEFEEKVTGTRISGAKRVAKNILIDLENDYFISIHLAMTGQLFLKEPGEKEPQWTKIVFHLQKDETVKILTFGDMRMFGKVSLMEKGHIVQLESKYGPEPINENLTTDEFLKRIRSKRTTIKNALLDQSVISGLGNIYATDALFLSRINPETPTYFISRDMAERLLKSSRAVLKEGITNRGSTLKDKMYLDIFGKEGKQQEHFKVYGKNKCPTCGSKLEFIKINSRGTFFCPTCQPKLKDVN